MKMHKSKVIIRDGGNWIRTTTLCGRMNKQSADGMNVADTDQDVTCKFCLEKMEAAQ